MRRAILLARHLRHLFGGREEQFEGGATSDFTVDPDGALVASYDSHYRRQPEAAPGELSGEERIEDSALSGVVHAATGVGDFEVDVAALRQLLVGEGRGQVLAV